MAAKVVTFRSGLKSRISDFLHDAAMECPQTEEALVGMVIKLADLREEGRSLFPRVLICDDLNAVLRNLQGSDPIKIGGGLRGPETVQRALKKCAPLADSGWAIWILREADAFSYGVFREPVLTALDLRQTLLDTEPGGPVRAVLVSQFAPGVVELVSAGDEGIRIHLSGEREDQVSAPDAEDLIVEWCSADIEDEGLRAAFSSFAGRIIHDILRKGHGALISVVPCGDDNWVKKGADAVLLESPIDLAALVRRHSNEPTSAVLSDLLGSTQLLAGMLSSDGITVLDSVGRILAYNWFVKSDMASLSPREQQGGARHRAYSALKELVDLGLLRGAFIRSTDGAELAYERQDDAE